jgi:hypothetical protein
VSESQNNVDHRKLKRTRNQPKAFTSSSSADPFTALNKMPAITPESPNKDHEDSKPKVTHKHKDNVKKGLASSAACPKPKTKVHHLQKS